MPDHDHAQAHGHSHDRTSPLAPPTRATGRGPLAYLRPGIAFEPMVCRWYAWPLLVSPSSFALIALNHLLPLLESFIEDPNAHRACARDPALAERLLQDMRARLQPQRVLAQAMLDANALLQREAVGQSLEPLYDRLPAPLRGLVELGYDVNHRASLRFFEPLLYAGACYDAGLQSVMLRDVAERPRPFMLSTPQLDAHAGLLMDLPFDALLLDDIARLRWQGADRATLDRLHQRLHGHGVDGARFAALLTDQPPPRRHVPPAPATLRVRYFGHASLLIESDGVTLMTDPSVACDDLHYVGDGPSGVPRYSFADLPDTIDYVLLTHNHHDHLLLATLLPLRHRIGTIVVPAGSGGFLQDPSLRLALQAAGFGSVVELQELQSLPIAGGALTGLPFLGEHGDLHIRTKLGYQVEVDGHAVMCLAASNNVDPALCERLRPLVRKPDLVFIGMECTGGPMSWLYGDLLSQRAKREHDPSRRLSGSDFARARGIVDLFSPRGVFVYAMGAEPWFTHVTSLVDDAPSLPIVESDQLVRHCHERGIQAERLVGRREMVLDAGELTVT